MTGPRLSVVTPEFCIHVTDVAADGVIPVRSVRTERVTGLVAGNGRPDLLDALAAEKDRFPGTLPPPGFAEALRDLLSRRWDRLRADEGLHAGTRASVLFSGWGKKPDYGDVAFRYTVTNFEHDSDDIVVDDLGVSPTFASYGGDYIHVDKTFDRPFSVTIAGLGEAGPRVHDKAEAIARAIKKGRRADEVALVCKSLVDTWRTTLASAPPEITEVVSCAPGTALVMLAPDGTVEAAIIDDKGARGATIAPF